MKDLESKQKFNELEEISELSADEYASLNVSLISLYREQKEHIVSSILDNTILSIPSELWPEIFGIFRAL